MNPLSVFLHSTGTGPFMWDFVTDQVAAEADRLAPVNFGYPPGAPLLKPERCDFVRDAAHVLSQIPGDRQELRLFAHSYGGLVALELLPKLGARVKSLFLYEPVQFGALVNDGQTDPAVTAEIRGFLDNPWFLEDEERGGNEEWLATFIDYWNRPGSWQRLPEPMQAHSRAVSWKMFQEVRSCFYGMKSFDERPLAKVPSMLVMGERSPVASRAMIAAVARRNPHARVLDLPRTGHMAPLTHPAAVLEAMIAHVQEL